MILINDSGLHIEESRAADSQDKQNFILTELATTFSDNVDFLRKVNKLTFGLQSKQ